MDPFDEHTQPLVLRAARFLARRGAPAYLVGGAIRDGALGVKTNDVDIAVGESPHDIGPSLSDHLDGQFVSLDTVRDIARIIVSAGPSRTYIDLSRFEDSIESDLRRRDFTVDAMAVDLGAAMRDDWDVTDPLGGRSDIASRTIRVVSQSVFEDDPVRLLRAARLAAETGFRIEPQTESIIRRDAGLLVRTSPERVREEMFKILAAPGAGRWVELMDELGVLSVLIPELDDARGVEQPKEHYYDVFGHLMSAVDHADRIVHGRFRLDFVDDALPRFEGFDAYFERELADGHTRGTFLKLTALLHDIAKPDTKTIEPSGRIRFFGHSEKGEETAGEILRRLRVGRRGVRAVRSMVRHHLRPLQMSDRDRLPSDRAIHRYYRDLGDVALDTLYLNMADFLAARGPLLTPAGLERHAAIIDHILTVGPQRPGPARSATRLLTGHDVMREFRISPGPAVGRILRVVSSAEADGAVSTRQEALDLARTHLETGGGGG